VVKPARQFNHATQIFLGSKTMKRISKEMNNDNDSKFA
jgi:hypothetical protein